VIDGVPDLTEHRARTSLNALRAPMKENSQMLRSLSIVSAVAGGVLLSGVALAAHTEPAKATKTQFALVNAFVQCNAPNTTTQASGVSACTPVSPTDGTCALMATGTGKLSLSVTGSPAKGNQAIKVGATVKGLSAGCEANQLCFVLSYRATNDDCPEGSCTSSDLLNWEPPGACCTVAGGACKISSAVNAANLDLADGKNTGLEFLGCGLKGPFAFFGPSLSCGLLLK
jgi:hypothetical protein